MMDANGADVKSVTQPVPGHASVKSADEAFEKHPELREHRPNASKLRRKSFFVRLAELFRPVEENTDPAHGVSSTAADDLWQPPSDRADWPHRPCVEIFKTDKSCLVTYFGVSVKLVKHQFGVLLFYAEWAKSHQGPAPDYKLREAGVTYGELVTIISRMRRSFRSSTENIRDSKIRQAAKELVDELFPSKKSGVGYFIGRPNLFRIL